MSTKVDAERDEQGPSAAMSARAGSLAPPPRPGFPPSAKEVDEAAGGGQGSKSAVMAADAVVPVVT